MATVGGVDIEIRGDNVHFLRELRQSERQAGTTGQRITREFRQADTSVRALNSSMGGLRSALGGVVSVLASGAIAKAVIDAADAFSGMRSRIALSISAADDLLAVEKQLYDQAVANRAALEPTVQLYQRLRGAVEGLTNEQTLSITDAWSKTLVISGASAQGAASSTLQFSQAIAGGVLRAEEFNSIIESNTRFVQALASSLGVSVGEVRKLVNEGVITTDVIFKALKENAAEFADEYKKIPLTVASAFVNVGNAFTSYIGNADQASGASATLAGFINSIANNFDRLAEVVIVAGTAIGGALGAQAVASVLVSLNGIKLGAINAARAMVALRAAQAFLLGPAGLLIAGAAIGTVFATVAINASKAEREFRELRTAATNAGSALKNFQDTGSTSVLQQQAIDLSKIKEEYYGIAAAAAAAAEAEKNRRVSALLSERSGVAAGLSALESRSGSRDLRRAGNLAERQQLEKDIALARALLEEYDAAIAEAANQTIPSIAEELSKAANSTKTLTDEERKAAAATEKKRLEEQKILEAVQLRVDLMRAEAQGNAAEVERLQRIIDIEELAQDYVRGGLALAEARIRAENEILNIKRAQAETDKRSALSDDVGNLLDELNQQAQENFDADFNAMIKELTEQGDLREALTGQVRDALEEGIRTGDWGDVFRDILAKSTTDALSEAINQLASILTDLLSSVVSSIGGSTESNIGSTIASIFMGGKAAGGSVAAGMRYIVGEQGPEMFVPSVPGTIVPQFEGPASAAANGVMGIQSMTITAPFIVQGSITEEVFPRVQAMMAAQARELPRVIDARVTDSLRRNRY
jgi:tape measure domain-containing protein